MKRKSIFSVVFSVTGVLLLGKLLGFVKQMVVAAAFGATLQTDLINLAQGFIGNMEYVLEQVLGTALVSVYFYAEGQEENGPDRLAGDTLKAATLIVGAVVAVMVLAAPWMARILAPTYSPEVSDALSVYLRMYSPALLLLAWLSVFRALLTANKRFLPREMVSINQSVLLLAAVALLSGTMGARALVVGFFAYVCWNTMYLGFLTRREWKLAGGNPFANPGVRKLLHMCGPLLLGYSVVYINQQVDKILVSGLEAGTVTALNYSAVLTNLVGTFIVTFASMLFPYVTGHIVREEHETAAHVTETATTLLLIAFLPISILTALCAGDIVAVVFGRGAFGADSVAIAASALTGYAFSFVPMTFWEVYSRVQYGYQDSKQPMINSTVAILCNIVLSITLCPHFGVFGVTFASSVAAWVCGALNMITARRHNPYLHYGTLLRQVPLLALGGVACGLIARWGNLHWWAAQGSLVRFCLATLCGGGAYLVIVSPLLYRTLREMRSKKT